MTRLPLEVHVFVRRQDEFLVLHRVPSGGSYWHSVAGGVEEGESFEETAARELREETGLDVRPVEIAEPYVYSLDEEPGYRQRFPDADGILVRVFLAEAPAGWEPQLNEEHDDYRWCSRDAAVELLYWPEPKEVLRTL